MRQRYLIGKLNRERYIESKQQNDAGSFLDNTYNPNQIYIQSTTVPRALQSSYAEMMGMYPPNTKTFQQLTEAEKQSLKQGKGMPRIKLSNGKVQAFEHHFESIVDNYQMIPVFTYSQQTINDDILFWGCPWAQSKKSQTEGVADTFKTIQDEYLEILKYPLVQAFKIPNDFINNITFPWIAELEDYQIAYDFEGQPRMYNYSPIEYEYLRHAQVKYLTIPVGEEGRQLIVTKELSKPINAMLQRVQEILSKNPSRDTLRYMIYSGHDDGISNTLLFLDPVNFEFEDVPYTSQVYFELYYDDDCVNQVKDHSCFTMKIAFNGHPLKFDTCMDANTSRGSTSPFCRFDDFIKHYNKKSYKGDYIEACSRPYTPGQ
eukprot:403368251